MISHYTVCEITDDELDMQMDETHPCKVMNMQPSDRAVVVFTPMRMPVVFTGTWRYRVVFSRGHMPSIAEALARTAELFPKARLDERGPEVWRLAGLANEDIKAMVVYVSKMDKDDEQ
jgi:hypothetical protein